jgi:mono/diheme cytochrome c family protein
MLRTALAALVLLAATTAFASQEGAALYKKSSCSLCHGADGKGNTPAGRAMKARDLGSPAVQKLSDEELAGVIKNGKGSMPSFKASLTETQIKQLVAFIRSLKHE